MQHSKCLFLSLSDIRTYKMLFHFEQQWASYLQACKAGTLALASVSLPASRTYMRTWLLQAADPWACLPHLHRSVPGTHGTHHTSPSDSSPRERLPPAPSSESQSTQMSIIPSKWRLKKPINYWCFSTVSINQGYFTKDAIHFWLNIFALFVWHISPGWCIQSLH